MYLIFYISETFVWYVCYVFFIWFLYRELGDYDSALEVLNTALALLVEDTQTLYLRGMLQVEGGHVENALNDFQVCSVDCSS